MNKTITGRSMLKACILCVLIMALFLITQASINEPERVVQADLNNNGILEDYILYKQQAAIAEKNKTIWRSPKEWQIDELLIGDVTNDGNLEMVILLWKEGNYGSSKPFWVNGEDKVWSNHLFVYSLAGDKVKEVWCSSALSQPLHSLEIITDSQDGNYLTAREKRWIFKLGLKDRIHLKWDEWGFVYLSPGSGH